jgi:hypothetical protein
MILVSVDDHVVEPAGMFEGRLPAKYVDAAPRLTRRPDGTMVWVYEGVESTHPSLLAIAGRPPSECGLPAVALEQMREGCYDIHARVKDMDANGQLGSMCFPSFVRFCGQLFFENGDRDQSLAMIRAYNDWHIDEWAGTYPGRIIPLALPVLWDPALCVAEIRRVAAKGCRALSFTSNPADLGLPSFYTDHWDPVWRACEEENMVVCSHLGSNSRPPTTGPDAPWETVFSLSPISSIEVASDLIWSKIFSRHPNLRFALSEGGIGWVPYIQERLDYIYKGTKHWTGMDLGGWLPSELFKEHVIVCFIDDIAGIEARHHMNLDNITWECDYPHTDSTWPNSPEEAMRYLSECTDDEINRITHLNAMRHFQYEPFKHIPREEATAGALRRKSADWDISIRETAHLAPPGMARPPMLTVR